MVWIEGTNFYKWCAYPTKSELVLKGGSFLRLTWCWFLRTALMTWGGLSLYFVSLALEGLSVWGTGRVGANRRVRHVFTYHWTVTYLSVAVAGVTSHGLSCGVCKYKAHKACVGNVLAGCKWSTRETVEQRFISLENVSMRYSLTTATFACHTLALFSVASSSAPNNPRLLSGREGKLVTCHSISEWH